MAQNAKNRFLGNFRPSEKISSWAGSTQILKQNPVEPAQGNKFGLSRLNPKILKKIRTNKAEKQINPPFQTHR